MASTPPTPRRGLPRIPGGEPWPPAASGAPGQDSADASAAPLGTGSAEPEQAASHQPESQSDAALPAAPPAAGGPVVPDPPRASTLEGRRGLPREPGGEPWPPALAPTPTDITTETAAEPTVAGARPRADAATAETVPPPGSTGAGDDTVAKASGEAASGEAASGDAASDVRRGLPREPGGEPWPPASVRPSSAPSEPSPAAAVPAEQARSDSPSTPTPSAAAVPAEQPRSDSPSTPTPSADQAPASASGDAEMPSPDAVTPAAPRPPLTVPRTVWPGAAASVRPSKGAEPKRLGPYTAVQWLGSAAVLGVFALALAAIVVLLARFVLALEPGREFLAAFPGEYPLPEGAPVGLPVWLNWSHFLNSFFLLFIIRTGWQVRREKRPAAFWSPRKNKRRRISLGLWFHQAVDILWIANGVIFVVLLFTTGQWMRIVPTSWEVFPHALSAALQYVSLDWPTENGWVNYNSLQQLSYFAITFVAAPLAIISGVRLSGVWPKDAERLNRLYPVEWARKIHFPVMLFFVAFIVVHVGLVLATGALRNLNHMYAARGSVDPGEYTSDPTGLMIFAASLLVMAAGWVAARPRVLVPIARLFGDVKQR